MPRPDAPHPVLAAFDRLTRKPMGRQQVMQSADDVALVRAALEAAARDRERLGRLPSPAPARGTSTARLTALLRELRERFPGALGEYSSKSPEIAYLAAIDALLLRG